MATTQHTEEQPAAIKTARALRRRLVLLVACALVVPAIAVATSLIQEKQYSATASLLFRDPQFDQKLFGSTVFQANNDPTRAAATNVRLVSLEVVASRTSRALHGKLTPDEVSGEVQVEAAGQSDVANITATDPSPQFAARLADTFAEQFIAFRRDADRSKIASAQQLVQQQLDALPASQRNGQDGNALRQRSEELKILAALQTGNAELVQSAQVPTGPSSPKPFRNGVIGLFLGILLGIAAALLLERLDRRLRDAPEIGDAFDRPVLGAIPESRAIAKSAQMNRPLGPAEAEAFRTLRANLRYFNVDRQIKSVAVTSASPGEGKSTVAMHLAVAAATGGTRVLLLEADLRRPTLASKLGLKSSDGLSQVLAGTRELRQVVNRVRLGSDAGEAGRSVDVLPAGPLPPNPSDLIESDRMRQVIRGAAATYDLVIVDTPPTAVVADAFPLLTEVTGVIVVARLGKATRESATHLRKQLENLHTNVLGVVVNSVGKQNQSYGGGYTYGYYELPAARDDYEQAETYAVEGSDVGQGDAANEFADAADRVPGASNGHGHSEDFAFPRRD